MNSRRGLAIAAIAITAFLSPGIAAADGQRSEVGLEQQLDELRSHREFVTSLMLEIDDPPLDWSSANLQPQSIEASGCRESVDTIEWVDTDPAVHLDHLDLAEPTAPVMPQDPEFPSKTFPPSNRTYSASDANLSFGAQYTPGERSVVAFVTTIQPAIRAIITSTVDHVVNRTPTYFHDHHNVPANYLFHWSAGDSYETLETMTGSMNFTVQVGGAPGTGGIDWRFNYGIHPDPCDPGGAC